MTLSVISTVLLYKVIYKPHKPIIDMITSSAILSGISKVVISARVWLSIFALYPNSIHFELFPSVDLKPPINQVILFTQPSLHQHLSHLICMYAKVKLALLLPVIILYWAFSDLYAVSYSDSEFIELKSTALSSYTVIYLES